MERQIVGSNGVIGQSTEAFYREVDRQMAAVDATSSTQRGRAIDATQVPDGARPVAWGTGRIYYETPGRGQRFNPSG